MTNPRRVADRRVIIDPRTQLGLDQLQDVLEELQIAIAWADRPHIGDGMPVVYGRPVRAIAQLIEAARRNLTPGPVDTLPALVERARADIRQDTANRNADQLTLAVPVQSRPAFANKAGAR